MNAQGLSVALAVIGITVVGTAVVVGLLLLCVALLGPIWGSVAAVSAIFCALFFLIAWVESR